MKRKPVIILFAAMLLCCQSFSQKILMKITGVTAPAGEEVRALEWKIERAATLPGGGGGTATAEAGNLTVKKTNGTSTNSLFKKMAQAAFMPDAVFEYYDASDILYYKITVKNVLLMQMFYLSPECPSCLKLEHQVGFTFDSIEVNDLVTGNKTIWNIKAGTVQ